MYPEELPTYSHATKFRALDFFPTDGSLSNETLSQHTTTVDECVAHLKFLALISDLRDVICRQNGIYGLWDESLPLTTGESYQRGLALIREKRWSIFVTKAVDRFEAWYDKFGKQTDFEAGYPLMTVHFNEKETFDPAETQGSSPFTLNNVPPLDVLMVWHAYMLNPRDFLEDCLRNRHLWLWKAGFPWEAINQCISGNLDFAAPQVARDLFKGLTGKNWDPQNDEEYKIISCPNCSITCYIPWTTSKQPGDLDHPFEDGVGFADGDFRFQCPKCSLWITNEVLKLEKFRRDAVELFKHDLPMPGTVLPANGVHHQSSEPQHTYANHILTSAIGLEKILHGTDYVKDPTKSVSDVRSIVEDVFKNRKTRKLLSSKRGKDVRTSVFQRISVRRMMGSYWENHSPFKLDLVGAVLRQGTFVKKMDDIDWLHSPALEHTMKQCIEKYDVFLQIVSKNTGKMAVPTLDVDLAWHTHQLSPLRYYCHCKLRTEMLINHDDKVLEGSLSDGFEWTSKQYHKITNGQLYSSCTCWYCEATRMASISTISATLFKSSTSAKVLKNSEELLMHHSEVGDKMVHISAHNAIAPSQETKRKDAAEMQHMKLINLFEKAARRLRKRGIIIDQPSPQKSPQSKLGDEKDTFLAWGILPKYERFFAPYAIDWNITTSKSMYHNNPACANFIKDAPGNCVSGMCAARVSAGACTNGESMGVPYGGCTAIASAAQAEANQQAAAAAAA